MVLFAKRIPLTPYLSNSPQGAIQDVDVKDILIPIIFYPKKGYKHSLAKEQYFTFSIRLQAAKPLMSQYQ